MNPSGNTILVTGGSAGIGRAMAIEFHKAGNTVIAAGRNRAALDELAAACPGMATIELDIADAAAVAEFAGRLSAGHPALNVLVNNAGIMRFEQGIDLAAAEAMIATNLLGPLRLTAALLPQLSGKPGAAIVNVSSTQAFVPLPFSPVYCATKAALHAWTIGLRIQLQQVGIEVIEVIPPAVQTELTPGQSQSPYAMPLDAFVAETMAILRQQPTPPEICVEQAHGWRAVASDEVMYGIMRQFGIPV
jgi:uncharacterized oxidoreductase